jgi:cytochrome c553
MKTKTSGMTAEDMRDIAEYFAVQKQPRLTLRSDALKVALGRERAEQPRRSAKVFPFASREVIE